MHSYFPRQQLNLVDAFSGKISNFDPTMIRCVFFNLVTYMQLLTSAVLYDLESTADVSSTTLVVFTILAGRMGNWYNALSLKV